MEVSHLYVEHLRRGTSAAHQSPPSTVEEVGHLETADHGKVVQHGSTKRDPLILTAAEDMRLSLPEQRHRECSVEEQDHRQDRFRTLPVRLWRKRQNHSRPQADRGAVVGVCL